MRRWLGDKCDIDVTRFSEAAFLFGRVARGTAITEQELERILPNVADVIQLITEPGFPTEQLRQRLEERMKSVELVEVDARGSANDDQLCCLGAGLGTSTGAATSSWSEPGEPLDAAGAGSW